MEEGLGVDNCEKPVQLHIVISIVSYITLTNLSTKYHDVQGIHRCRWYKIVIPCLSACTEGNPIAKARGLSPRTGEQPMV